MNIRELKIEEQSVFFKFNMVLKTTAGEKKHCVILRRTLFFLDITNVTTSTSVS